MSLQSQFILSQADSRPMYLQIIEQIKNKVALGEWPSGYKLPSIRELAVAVKVSVITIKRAYQELELQGVIVTQQGKGSFVALNKAESQGMKFEVIDDHLTQALKAGNELGLSVSEIKDRLKGLADSLLDSSNNDERGE